MISAMRRYIDATHRLCEAMTQRLLVIVHPGSACGSADFNLGHTAGTNRRMLAQDIAQWHGGVLVIDGELSDELPRYPALQSAITKALNQAKSNGFIAQRVYGDAEGSPNQMQVARRFIKTMKLQPRDWQIALTGAWADAADGCVASVRDVFHRAGFRADIRDSAMHLDRSINEAVLCETSARSGMQTRCS
jgi:hypothetical protein